MPRQPNLSIMKPVGNVPTAEPAMWRTNTNDAGPIEISKDLANAGSTGATIPLASPDAPAGSQRDKKMSRFPALREISPLEGGAPRESFVGESVVNRPSLFRHADLFDDSELFRSHGRDGKAVSLLENHHFPQFRHRSHLYGRYRFSEP